MPCLASPDRPRLRPLFLSILLGSGIVGGCAVGPAPRAPQVSTLGVAEQYRAATPADPTVPLTAWWDTFADPTLTALLRDARAQNTDLEVATLRLRQARAALVAANGALVPSVGASVGRNRSAPDVGPVTNLTTASLTASYEVDLFGGKRRARTAARADRDTAFENRRAVELSMTAEVAINYISERAAARRLQLAQATLAAQSDTLQLVRWRALAGLASDVEVEQAAQLVAQTRASLPDLAQARDAAITRLATLTGRPAEAVAVTLKDTTAMPVAPLPTAPLPLDALRRRPDVLSAEHTVVAELARVGVRQAAIFPALTLGGSVGGVGPDWASATRAPLLQLTGLLSGSLFRGGQDWAALESQKAQAAIATASYRGVVRAAMEDLENSLSAVAASAVKTAALAEANDAAGRALALAKVRYDAGLIDFSALLDTQRTALSTEQSTVQAQADRAIAVVRLYKALGGGWSAAPTASPAQE